MGVITCPWFSFKTKCVAAFFSAELDLVAMTCTGTFWVQELGGLGNECDVDFNTVPRFLAVLITLTL